MRCWVCVGVRLPVFARLAGCRGVKKKKKTKKPAGDTQMQEMDSAAAEPSPEPELQPEADDEDAGLSPEEKEVPPLLFAMCLPCNMQPVVWPVAVRIALLHLTVAVCARAGESRG